MQWPGLRPADSYGLLTFVVLSVFAIRSSVTCAKKHRPGSQKLSSPSPKVQDYDIIWALASRTSKDPFGEQSGPGVCKHLLDSPKAQVLKRKQCKPDMGLSFVPLMTAFASAEAAVTLYMHWILQGIANCNITPRYVDVRFDPRPTIAANSVLGVEMGKESAHEEALLLISSSPFSNTSTPASSWLDALVLGVRSDAIQTVNTSALVGRILCC
ncbi:hypothetical protein VOLCADRAFT_86104 [Volvox carteri f. nagariensis]|uniref:Uncharacterized protein n=1 Tax=Volvox carteri f. nagariensis TaxID=3068 RepID=D8THV9_VOLCA|nr:uncharacterized protein VOLCADRAFT_86104 [Volvox carteri f. nagariensis]EFJ52784.1 hypothetical protein VOLCADRAFT_86104 [Volvox carteri f. nagariensis]|eukprot:XP_002945789.1 hypothetical protein VOLCADRAFT_86104 [Volvox carteri f. nagariensis]